ncbi:hypothetical protein ACHAPU_002695 [Fusarium lateritium]
MATLSSLDINTTAPAVIAWQWNDAPCLLAQPDPQIRDITLSTRFDSTGTFFQLNVPIRVKGIRTGTTLILRILSSSISSFDFAQSATVPDAVRDKFHSSTLLLDFVLDQHPQILISTEAQEPLSPSRAQSGIILDAVHQLANITSLSVYIKASEISKTQLQSVRDAISQGLSLVIQNDLTSMFGGKGAKVVSLPPPVDSLPPSYEQTEPPPPLAPIYDRKRPRKDSREERDEDIALIWAQLGKIQKLHREEIYALKEENQDLKQEIGELRERLATSENKQQELKEEFNALEARSELKGDELGDEMDLKIIETNADVEELSWKITSMREELDQDELVNRVKYKVLDHIKKGLSYDDD